MDGIKWGIHMLMLGFCSVEDWREKEISLWKIAMYAAAITGYGIWELIFGKEDFYTWLIRGILGAVPGVGMLLLGRFSHEAVGYGDGLLILILGASAGFWEALGILMTAFLGIFAAAVYGYVKNGRKKGQIAFVPFLFLGMAGAGLWIIL